MWGAFPGRYLYKRLPKRPRQEDLEIYWLWSKLLRTGDIGDYLYMRVL